MDKKEFRTYKRRSVTRKSGNKASGFSTGGECLVLNSEKIILHKTNSKLTFYKDHLLLESLFEKNIGLIAFGGYIKASNNIDIKLRLSYKLEDNTLITEEKTYNSTLKTDVWNGIGIHSLQRIDDSINQTINTLTISLCISGQIGTEINFTCFDFNSVNYQDYLSEKFYKPFNQKTNMHVPHIYYLETQKKLKDILSYKTGSSDIKQNGDLVVLKSCNRCTRYLPINFFSELDTLAFSLHCKKKAPCKHSIFAKYFIKNIEYLNEIQNLHFIEKYIDDKYLQSYYGHQLECKSCKKYYVNFALNPLRNPQQFKEDGLRRRALEVLVNTLLDKNLIHHDFEFHNKKEFSEYIWEKFDKKCFKCGKLLKLSEMHLDHTMPLAYLYRLDESATCLCSEHNSQKSDSFPKDYYSKEELVKLSEITNLDLNILSSTSPNMKVVLLLIENIEWFFDEFLMYPEYQKVRDNILTADKIYASLVRILKNTGIDLLNNYYSKTGYYPKSITYEH